MAMNFNQMLKFQQMKNSLKRFDRDHPKFKNFLNAVTREQALREGAVIELSVTSPEGKNQRLDVVLQESNEFRMLDLNVLDYLADFEFF